MGARAFVEFVDLKEDQPVEEGLGRLVATAFFPLSEMMPILRYDTEDVFYNWGECPARGMGSYEYFGRISDLIAAPQSDGKHVSLSMIADALDDFAEVARARNPRIEPLDVLSPVGGPIFHCTRERSSILVTIQIDSTLDLSGPNNSFENKVRTALLDRFAKSGIILNNQDLVITCVKNIGDKCGQKL